MGKRKAETALTRFGSRPFLCLCFGEDAPSARAANRFVECFYTWETRTRTVDIENDDGTVTSTEEYTVAVPVSLYQAYANLEAELGRTITEDDKSNINHIYSMIAGTAGSGNYNGEFLRGDGSSIDLDISALLIPTARMPPTWSPMLSTHGNPAGAMSGEPTAMC